jgi:hypothetical protein
MLTREQFIYNNILVNYPIGEDYTKYGLNKEAWVVYRRLFLLFIWMKDTIDNFDVAKLILRFCFVMAIKERIAFATGPNGRWKILECSDNCRYIIGKRFRYDEDDYAMLRREKGFQVDVDGNQYYFEDLFLYDDWMDRRQIKSLVDDRYYKYQRNYHAISILSVVYTLYILIDCVGDFYWSEEILRVIYPHTLVPSTDIFEYIFAYIFRFCLNPLRIMWVIATAYTPSQGRVNFYASYEYQLYMDITELAKMFVDIFGGGNPIPAMIDFLVGFPVNVFGCIGSMVVGIFDAIGLITLNMTIN